MIASTVTINREPIGVPTWIADALSQAMTLEDLVHELATVLEDEILAHPEVVEAQAKLDAIMDRVGALDEQLAGELSFLVDGDHYCSVVRATLTAVLAREAAAVGAVS